MFTHKCSSVVSLMQMLVTVTQARRSGASGTWKYCSLRMRSPSFWPASRGARPGWLSTPTCSRQVFMCRAQAILPSELPCLSMKSSANQPLQPNGWSVGGRKVLCLNMCDTFAGAFPHRPKSSDFLLVRSAAGALSVRHLTGSIVVGQQEPLMRIPVPKSKESK